MTLLSSLPGSRWVSSLMLVALLAPSLVTLCGCRSGAHIVSVDLHATEKDVLVCSVELDSPLTPQSYLDWASRNIVGFGDDVANPFYETPVYELLYSFRQGSTQLATVLYRRDDEAAGHLEHHRTLVYYSGTAEVAR